MQLERTTAELRSRPPFEAADLGVRLLRALARPTLRAWLGFVLPLQLLMLLACASLATGYSYLALWWLKPVYERAFGLVLGHGLFGDPPGLGALYRGLLRDGRRGLLGDLSWRRLDPARTLVAPVALLEGLSGKGAARRRRTLGERNTAVVAWLISACAALELATTFGLAVGAKLLLPDEATWIADELWTLDPELVERRMILGCYVLALAVVEPLFVAAGFGLYVNRRTNIEGWDVELTFRRMARRLATLAGAGAAAALIALSLPSGPAWIARAAAEAPELTSTSAVDETLRLPAPRVDDDGQAARAMARVLARPELSRMHTEEYWELRHRASEAEPTQERSAGWLSTLANIVAQGFVALIWTLAALALVVVIYLVIQRAERLGPRASEAADPSEREALVQEHSGRPLSLREIVPRAMALWAEGQHAAALSVLYVGTLQALTLQDGLELPQQATEGQCLAAVRRAPIAEERRALFIELTQLWQLVAYAHARPEEARLHELCGRFRACFGVGA